MRSVRKRERFILSHYLKMLRIPFPTTGTTENITLFRGGKRSRRDALKDVSNSIPVVTILKRPSPAPPARQPPAPAPAPPPVTILMKPKRQAANPQARGTQASSSPASAAPVPAPKARSAAHVSFAVVVPADHSPRRRGVGRTAPPAPGTGFRPERMVRLPTVIIHEPVWWDNWTDVDHPRTSYGEMLDVPHVNWRGKMDVDDLVRFYPKERSAEQMLRKLRCLERSRTNRHSAAARRHGRSGQKAAKACSRTTPTTPPRSASATCPTSPPHAIYFF
ncbi:hypothetical protein EI94DRAFT_1737753 [Lactarius quietus]|nr:hypothetical protein EI94DRAFT_1737753 [Lactarius quietus]